MKKLKIYAAAVLAVMLLNVPFIFAENETIVVDGEATTTQTEYKDYGKSVFLVNETGKLTINKNVIFSSNTCVLQAHYGNGGAIFNKGKVIIKDNVVFSSNTTKSFGGGICNIGTITAGNNIKFSFNKGSNGGAIYALGIADA
ncbi:MAG: hypothetical protein II598_01900, partial [Elusimicrobia bacterium]|nr:hypothetical protein [Elusimicrobiota bacterium]